MLEAEARTMGHAIGYLLVQGMQEGAPLHCDLVAGEELSIIRQWGVIRRVRDLGNLDKAMRDMERTTEEV